MAVAFDAVGPSSAGQSVAGTTTGTSWSHTCTGSNLVLIVQVAGGNTTNLNVTGVTFAATYNGVSMTQIGGISNTGGTGVVVQFGLIAPATGANTVAVTVASTPTGGIDLECGSTSFTGADQVTGWGTPVTASSGGSASLVSASISTTHAGGMCTGAICGGNSIASATSPSVSRWIDNQNSNSGGGEGAGATSASTGSAVTMAWAWSSGTHVWAFSGVEVLAPAGAAVAVPASPAAVHGPGWHPGQLPGSPGGTPFYRQPAPSVAPLPPVPTFTPVGSMQFPDTGQGVGMSTVSTGDLLVCQVVSTDRTNWCTGLSGASVTWTQVTTVVKGVTENFSAVGFFGVVNTPVTNQNLTPSWQLGTAPTFHTRIREFTVSTGQWFLDTFGSIDSAGTASWASLTPAAAGELYWGWAGNSGTASPGTTSGFTYELDLDGDGAAFNPACGSGAVQAVWADSQHQFGLMMLVSAAQPSTASLAGAGSVTAVATVIAPATAAGAGAVTDVATQAATAALPGAGAVADAATEAVTATAAGAGAVTGTVTGIAGGPCAGAGAVAAVVTQACTASLAGAGAVSANASVISGANTATLPGAGSVTAVVTEIVTATSAGAGSVTAAVTQGTGANLAGAGAIGAPDVTQAVAASLAGAGSVTAAVTQIVTATLTGAGTLSATTGGFASGTASLAGAGALTAAGSVSAIATASLAGAGSLTTVITECVTAAPAGAGTVSASPSGLIPGTATLTGAGTLTAAASQHGAIVAATSSAAVTAADTSTSTVTDPRDGTATVS